MYTKWRGQARFRSSVVGVLPHERFQTAKTDYSCHFGRRDIKLAATPGLNITTRRSEHVHDGSWNLEQLVLAEQKHSQAAALLAVRMRVKQAEYSQKHVAGETAYWFDYTQPPLQQAASCRSPSWWQICRNKHREKRKPQMSLRQSKHKKQMHRQPFRRVWVCLPHGGTDFHFSGSSPAEATHLHRTPTQTYLC